LETLTLTWMKCCLIGNLDLDMDEVLFDWKP
jgi:hypothetical protein